MPRTLLAMALLALLLMGRPALGNPPAGVSGKMVLDEVADGLRKFRRARTAAGRKALLNRLAPIQDPRVAVLLGEIATDRNSPLWLQAAFLLDRYHIPEHWEGGGLKYTSRSKVWWEENEADLRRRAKELP